MLSFAKTKISDLLISAGFTPFNEFTDISTLKLSDKMPAFLNVTEINALNEVPISFGTSCGIEITADFSIIMFGKNFEDYESFSNAIETLMLSMAKSSDFLLLSQKREEIKINARHKRLECLLKFQLRTLVIDQV